MKETKKTLIIIAIMVTAILGLGLFYNYNMVNAGGSGSNPNADVVNGSPYDVSKSIFAELGAFRRRWWGRLV